MPSHSGSQHYGSPARLATMSSRSSSRISVEGSLHSISKYRIKVVARQPLPNFNFLAPYEPHVPQALTLLQSYIHKQLSRRANSQLQRDLMKSIGPESIRLEMDDFAIPLDEPELLRDGDSVEACLATELESSTTVAGMSSEKEDEKMSSDSSQTTSSSSSQDDSDQSTDDSGDESDGSDFGAGLSSDARDALLDGKRIAALLKAGIHQILPEDDANTSATVRNRLHEDFPKPPAPSRPSDVKKDLPSTSQPLAAFPLRPPTGGGAGGAAAAMVAFEAQKKQLHARKNNAPVKNRGNDNDLDIAPFVPFPAYSVLDHLLKKAATKSDSASKNASKNRLESSQQPLDSDSDSNSSSAPSVESIRRLPNPTGASLGSADVEVTVPPGKGTSRTRRRNQLRRKKQHFLKEAENKANFVAAKQRAEERQQHMAEATSTEAKEAVAQSLTDEEVKDGPLVAARTGIEVVISQHSVVAKAPTTAGMGAGKKRKRQEASPDSDPVPSPDIEQDQSQYVSARTVPPSELPPDQIPSCITISRVDCEQYYEAELRKLELQQEVDVHEETDDIGLVDAQLRRKATLPIDLDYGDADTSEEGTARKRVKIDSAAPASELRLGANAEGENPLSDTPTSDDPQAQLWTEVQRQPPESYLDTKLAPSFRLDAFAKGSRVVFRDIALHPTKRLPEVMTFIGIALRCSSSSVELDVKGPLFASAHWDELENEHRIWTHTYHPDEICIL